MTPREVDQLSTEEYQAFWEYLEADNRELERQARAARRRR